MGTFRRPASEGASFTEDGWTGIDEFLHDLVNFQKGEWVMLPDDRVSWAHGAKTSHSSITKKLKSSSSLVGGMGGNYTPRCR